MKPKKKMYLGILFLITVIQMNVRLNWASAEYVGWDGVNDFYLRYSYRFDGVVKINGQEIYSSNVSQFMHDYDEFGGDRMDILSVYLEFIPYEKSIYSVSLLCHFLNYTFNGNLFFDFNTYQFYNINDTQYDSGIYGLFIIPLESDQFTSSIPICTYDIRKSSYEEKHVSKSEFSEIYYSNIPSFTNLEETQSSNTEQSHLYMQNISVNYVSENFQGTSWLTYASKYGILLEGGIADSFSVLLEKAEVLPEGSIMINSFRLYETDLELFQTPSFELPKIFFILAAIGIIIVPVGIILYIRQVHNSVD